MDLWLGQDGEWAAKSMINRANRGTEGVHAQGNRNHFVHKKLQVYLCTLNILLLFTVTFLCMTNLCLVVQEEKLKRPLSHMEAWEIAHTRRKPKAGEGQYYGKTAQKKKAYSEGYLRLHPDTPDPMKAALDDRVVVGMGPKAHGRQPVLDAVVTPSISYTQLRATDPSLSQRTRTTTTSAQSHSLLAERHSVSIFPLIFIAHFIFCIEMFNEFHHVIL